MSRRSPLVLGAYFLGLAYIYGLILGSISLAWQALFRDGMPGLSWWQWLLAPLALGALAMAAEAAFEWLQNATGFGAERQGRVKRALHLIILFVIFSALIIGPALYSISRP